MKGAKTPSAFSGAATQSRRILTTSTIKVGAEGEPPHSVDGVGEGTDRGGPGDAPV